MVYRCENFRNDKGMVVLQSLQISHASIIPNRFYETPKLKNWMCELCTLSQIQSLILMLYIKNYKTVNTYHKVFCYSESVNIKQENTTI